ncbi:MAG: peptidoglycan bridge formation glycyltransferase FemA/FemB family protein [Candidatus Saccharimonadales bacterium]
MTVRFATKSEIDNWNSLIIANPDGGNVFASYEFAMQKESGGYRAKFVMVDNLAVTVLEKKFPALGKLWYLPKGPGATDTSDLHRALKAIEPIAKQSGAFALRIESELPKIDQPVLEQFGLVKTRHIIPNPSTITLDISANLDEVLINLPQKGRHAIRRAQRDGVTVKLVRSTEENCQIMYKMLSETAEGQFGIRSYKYFCSFWKRFEAADYGQMFFAYFEGQIVAGAYAMTYGKKSTYKDGASIRKRTAYGASHLLQWRIIEWAKSHGACLHDFCGSPPSDEINNPAHPHYGIGLFKSSFNKTVTDYIGCYDYIISPKKYRIWIKFAEKVAYRVHYYKYHDSYF